MRYLVESWIFELGYGLLLGAEYVEILSAFREENDSFNTPDGASETEQSAVRLGFSKVEDGVGGGDVSGLASAEGTSCLNDWSECAHRLTRWQFSFMNKCFFLCKSPSLGVN